MKTIETIEQIIIDEGYRAEPYLCSEGYLTWLIGRNIQNRPITENEWEELSYLLNKNHTLKDWAVLLFYNEISDLSIYFNKININLEKLPKTVACIILNMAYNMGVSRFNQIKWPKFFKAIEKKDFIEASMQMIDSRWYKQVKTRSERLVKSMALASIN